MILTRSVSFLVNSPDEVMLLTHVGADGSRWAIQTQISALDQQRHSGAYGAASADSAEDLNSSHRLFMRFFPDEDAQVGATNGTASSEVFNELHAQGETAIDVIEIPPGKGMIYDPSVVAQRRNFRGTLKRVGAETLRVLIDGVPVMLPVLHAKGILTARDLTHTFEFWWLDDPDVRLPLRYRFEDYTEYRVVRIDYPGRKESGAALSQSLAKTCRAELSGIYFAFGSANLLEASRPALQSIATVIKQHPDWRFTIEGHTDNLGSDEANLALSRNRAAAVAGELTGRYGVPAQRVKTDGFGRKHPIDSNDSADGRAHNRRVEVARTC